MKNLLFLFLFTTVISYGQSQLGFTTGVNYTTIKSNDFTNPQASAGFVVGLNALLPLYEKADWLLEFSYETGGFNAEGYRDFNQEDVFVSSEDKIKISSFDTKFLVNQYIIVPEAAAFHVGVQGGIGLSMIKTFKNDDYPIFEDASKFKPYYIIGLSGGSEELRLNLRYNGVLGNALSGIIVKDMPDEFNRADFREFNGSQNNISISLTYYFNTFSY